MDSEGCAASVVFGMILVLETMMEALRLQPVLVEWLCPTFDFRRSSCLLLMGLIEGMLAVKCLYCWP
jgi:hypothetical protein